MRKLIEVTQEDIDHGKRLDSSKCPIARAIKRHFPTSETMKIVQAGLKGIYYWDNHMAKEICPTPRSAYRFIRKFDRWGRNGVKPFNFYMESV